MTALVSQYCGPAEALVLHDMPGPRSARQLFGVGGGMGAAGLFEIERLETRWMPSL